MNPIAPHAGARPGEPRAAEILAQSLERLWGDYSKNYRLLSRPGPEGSAVHDLRVAVRRLLSALSLARACAGIRARGLRRELRSTMRRLGPVRDAEVHAAKLRPLLGRYRSLRALHLALVREHAAGLAGQRSQMPPAALSRQSREMARLLERVRGEWLAVDAALPAQVRRRLAKRNRRVSRALRHVPSGAAPALHRLRVALKGLRYTLELAKLHYPDVFAESLLEEARRWQGALGEIQDWHTLTVAARAFAPDTPDAVARTALAALNLRRSRAIARVTRRHLRLAAFVDRVAVQAANLNRPDEHAPVPDAAWQRGGAERFRGGRPARPDGAGPGARGGRGAGPGRARRRAQGTVEQSAAAGPADR